MNTQKQKNWWVYLVLFSGISLHVYSATRDDYKFVQTNKGNHEQLLWSS